MQWIKQKLTKSNLINMLFVVLFLTLIFVPSAKAFVIRGLMEIGWFKASPTAESKPIAVDLTGIAFKDQTGRIVSLNELKGKIIFLNFWATWCPPCLAEMPSINKLYEQFKDDKDIVFLLVDADGDFEQSQAYMQRKKYALPVFAMASNVPEIIFKGSLPTTVVFDHEGRISFKGEGAANYASPKFISFIKKLKAAK